MKLINSVIFLLHGSLLMLSNGVVAGDAISRSLCEKESFILEVNDQNEKEKTTCGHIKKITVVVNFETAMPQLVSYDRESIQNRSGEELNNLIGTDWLYKIDKAPIRDITINRLFELLGRDIEVSNIEAGDIRYDYHFPDISERVVKINMYAAPFMLDRSENLKDKAICFVQIEAVPCKNCSSQLFMNNYTPIIFSFTYSGKNSFIDEYRKIINLKLNEMSVRNIF